MKSRVAVVQFGKDSTKAFTRALDLIGGIDDLNAPKRAVATKVGVFDHKSPYLHHTTVSIVKAIARSFDKAASIYLVESDNYKGKALERLRIWEQLFSKRVQPFSLSDDADARVVKTTGGEMSISHMLFKPRVLVSTHVWRAAVQGSVLKNLFGCVPTPKKVRFHKILNPLLADIFEATGGVDLAVLDGTRFFPHMAKPGIRMNTLIVGRDAVAVEAVGASLAGLEPDKMPIIQEFARRYLGQASMDNIDIVGTPPEELKEKVASLTKHPKGKSRRK